MPLYLIRFWREALIALLCAVSYFEYRVLEGRNASYAALEKSFKDTSATLKTVVDNSDKKEHVRVVVVRKPDGTITKETVKDIETKTREDLRQEKREAVQEADKGKDLSRYQVSILAGLNYPFDKTSTLITAGARLGDLPIFVTAGAYVYQGKYTLGLTWEY